MATDASTDALAFGRRDFTEGPELHRLIDELSDASCEDIVQREVNYEKFLKIIDHYQEQPHVIDPYLEPLIAALLRKGRDRANSRIHVNQTFSYVYLLIKMRGYKVVIRYFPHEVSDLEPILSLLEEQSASESSTWQTRYVLLLWLSIVVKVPFDLSRFDAGGAIDGTMDRILGIGRAFLWSHDVGREASAFMLSQFLTRPDVKTKRLEVFVSWALDQVPMTPPGEGFQSAADLAALHGTLTSLALIFKHGQREDVVVFASRVLRKLLDAKMEEHPVPTVRRLATKIINRIGLVFLPVRIASWRYTRGARSLEDNLAVKTVASNEPQMVADDDDENDDGLEIPDEVEEIVESMLNALKDRETIVRWSAAKGVGRVTGRLPREFADQVVGSVLEMFTTFEGDGAWHGGCLTLAELGRRGLLLPDRLSQVVPVVVQALVYEDRRGNYALGAHVRDAACYVCWSFARAYDPSVIRPYVETIAGALLVTTVFDREVNCRRAASAAFQENVGRQGEFPHGIDILTTADYFAVGNRANAYVTLGRFVAQFPEYTKILLEHLIDSKVAHWDPVIRELASSSLAAICDIAPTHVVDVILPRLASMATSSDMETRHGAIIATGEVTLGLRNWARNEKIAAKRVWNPEDLIQLVTEPTWMQILDIIPALHSSNQFKGLAGEWTKKACCRMIRLLSEAQLPIQRHAEVSTTSSNSSTSFSTPQDVKQAWLRVINDLLHHAEPTVTALAVDALPHFCSAYFDPSSPTFEKERKELLDHYEEVIVKAILEKSRQGHCLALAALPRIMYVGHVTRIIATLQTAASKGAPETAEWADSRRDAVSALAKVTLTVGFPDDLAEEDPFFNIDNDDDARITPALFDSITATTLASLDDYTTDSRGDVGSLVREAALLSLQQLLCSAAKDAPSFLSPSFVAAAINGVIQQTCEKIDRTRAVAGRAFAAILWPDDDSDSHNDDDPNCVVVPHLPRGNQLRAIFTREFCKSTNWSSPETTFPAFSQLLRFEEFTFSVLLGCVVSVGGLTESLVVSAGETLANFFHDVATDEKEFQLVAESALAVFRTHLKNERVSIPYMKMMEQLMSAGCFERVVDTPTGQSFALELIDLIKKETSLSKNPQKLMAAADLLCGSLQFPAEARKKALSQLAIFLCHRYPRVRKTTAEKLYEALITYDDICGEEEDDEKEEDGKEMREDASKLDSATTLLSETQWDAKDVNDIKTSRNQLCDILGIKPPVAVPKKNIA